MNIFRAFGDLFHLLSILILLYRLMRVKSCKGLSAKTQILHAIIFVTRYLDLLYSFISTYNTVMKAFYIIGKFLVLFLMLIKYKSTYDREKDSFRIEILLLLSIILAFCFNGGVYGLEILWCFSIYLEAVAILPQFLLICKLENCEAYLFHYITSLTLYRGFYVLNWVYRYYFEQTFDKIQCIAGLIQLYIYLDFIFRLRLTSTLCKWLNLKPVNVFNYGSTYIVDTSAVTTTTTSEMNKQDVVKIVVTSTL